MRYPLRAAQGAELFHQIDAGDPLGQARAHHPAGEQHARAVRGDRSAWRTISSSSGSSCVRMMPSASAGKDMMGPARVDERLNARQCLRHGERVTGTSSSSIRSVASGTRFHRRDSSPQLTTIVAATSVPMRKPFVCVRVIL